MRQFEQVTRRLSTIPVRQLLTLLRMAAPVSLKHSSTVQDNGLTGKIDF
jgi:hypothetical protein